MAKTKKKNTPKTKKIKSPKEITFHYLKTPSYRTFYADGFFGGLTPKGQLYMEIYLERQPTPQKVIYKTKEGGLESTPKSKEGKEGFIREVEAGVIMDYSTMVVLRNWLNEKIDLFEKRFLKANSSYKVN